LIENLRIIVQKFCIEIKTNHHLFSFFGQKRKLGIQKKKQ